MPELNHPAAAAERAHLADTVQLIHTQRTGAERDLVAAEAALSAARRSDPDALPVREMLYTRAAQAVRGLALAADKPYFTRIDFTETAGAANTYYIGKFGVLQPDTLSAAVVDWRAPVANLYYSGQIGPMQYEAPDGTVAGELTLKRQFGIEAGELQSIFDADLVTQEAYLQAALSAMNGDRLREIVTTIQAEQNYVIRYPLNRSLVVQGAAGSGKTTIALHRIAYLLYAWQDRLRPEQLLILAPNPLFLNYISQVLPDLGVENVRQTTFPRLLRDWLGDALPPLADADSPAQANDDARRYKGSLACGARLQAWLDGFEQRFPPEDGLAFGPVPLYSPEELRRFLLEDEKPFPLARRLQELKKQLAPRVKWAADRLESWYREECSRRIARLRETAQPGPEREARIQRLRASLEARLKDLQAQKRRCVRQALSAFPALDPVSLYAAFWRDELAAGASGAARRAAEETLTRLEVGAPLTREDAAPLALIAMRVLELRRPNIRHIVIDEAQDFSPLEVALLARMAEGATFTIVGDLMQGIHGDRGLENWRELTEGVFAGRAVRHDLLTSYRSTIEIMSLAIRVMRNLPQPGLAEPKPVLRHGKAPRLEAVANEKARAAAVQARLRTWQAEGLKSIAVIARDPALLEALETDLSGEFALHRLDPEEETYSGGLLLAPADGVKGLEFDGVILADASAAAFPASTPDARLLYVCLTRALHRLDALYTGELTPLLRDAEQGEKH